MMFWRKKNKSEEQPKQAEEQEIPLEQKEDQAVEQQVIVPEHDPEPETEPEIKDAPIQQVVEVPESFPEADEVQVEPQAQAEEPEQEEEPVQEEESNEGGWFSRLSKGLSKSTNKITQGIGDLITKKKLDQDTLDELEEILITADLGPSTAAKIVEEFGKDRFGKEVSEDEIKEVLAQSISDILRPVAQPMVFERREDGKPMVVLVSGVNGVGKTTTIGKIAHELHFKEGKKIMLAAGDTFRAAAVEQLNIWADRSKSSFYGKDIGADAASVAYEAYEKALAENVDVLFIDTAGRLHNKTNLMAELEKIIRVLKKKDENLPHEVLLILDSTTGQNAHDQLRTFKEMINVTGLAVTKLDGSAKGGVVVSLADQFGMPICLIGVGEQIGDLQPFDPEDFAKSLVGLV